MKSSVEEIRQRFDNDVERFSNLDTGQAATVDAPLVMSLVTEAAAATTPGATDVLDIGCGAGNYCLKLIQAFAETGGTGQRYSADQCSSSAEKTPGGEYADRWHPSSSRPVLNFTLLDLSRPMLDRAVSRVSAVTSGSVTAMQGDIRDVELGEAKFDIVMAAAVLHHLRDDDEWRAVFAKVYRALRAGGSFWVADLVAHSTPAVQAMMWNRYGEYLVSLKGEAYRDHVFAYVEKEDTPRPLAFQLDLLRGVGFAEVEVLHKNSCFAAFGGVKLA